MNNKSNQYDVIVVGGGHAGIEAAHAAAKMGAQTCLITMNVDQIGAMPCNPAIGGTAKGHLVKEIDALGGVMGQLADRAGIQFKTLNSSKGPAIWSSRAQCDRDLYRRFATDLIQKQDKLTLRQDTVIDIIFEQNRVSGITTKLGQQLNCKQLIITTGTFLSGNCHIGKDQVSGGRLGDNSATQLAHTVKKMGLHTGRLKTGTVPRLDAKSIDFSELEIQTGDAHFIPFSYRNRHLTLNNIRNCHITYTNPITHKIIRENLHRSAMYGGGISGVGPRYCPSIEDKVTRFATKERHQIFLEPEGLATQEIYPNGLSTSLPFDVQISYIRSIKGLENAEIIRPGYAVEYDFINPVQLDETLLCQRFSNLYFAGQVNGTSGYEEAAGQGLIAGINAAQRVFDKPPFTLARSQAYLGVLIDDLVTKGCEEPYRMFTSKAEFRLGLREDNACDRLLALGYQLGLVDPPLYEAFCNEKAQIDATKKVVSLSGLKNHHIERFKALALGSTPKSATMLSDLLKRPEIDYSTLSLVAPELPKLLAWQTRKVSIDITLEGYISRQNKQAQKMARLDEVRIPVGFDFQTIPGLSNESKEVLIRSKPTSLGQASRLQGVSPATISILHVFIHKKKFHVEQKDLNLKPCST